MLRETARRGLPGVPPHRIGPLRRAGRVSLVCLRRPALSPPGELPSRRCPPTSPVRVSGTFRRDDARWRGRSRTGFLHHLERSRCPPRGGTMKRSLGLTAVILIAVLTRLLPHPPNFAPITAMAVFAGVTYTSRRSTILVPLAALFLSDLVREVLYRYGLSTSWGIYSGMWTVYITTALIALLGRSVRETRSVNAIAMVTLIGSCLFF